MAGENLSQIEFLFMTECGLSRQFTLNMETY